MQRGGRESMRAVKRQARRRQGRKPNRGLIVLTAALLLAVSTTLIAGSRGRSSSSSEQTRREQIAPAGLSAAGPAKEYVYVGGRLIATEEPGACFSISPASASFAASS